MNSANDGSGAEEHDRARLLMEQAQTQLHWQLDFSDALDSKAQLVLSSGSIVITLGSGFVGVAATRGLSNVLYCHVAQVSLSITPLGLYIVGLLLYVIAVFLSGWAYFVRTFSLAPDPTLLVGKYIEKPSSEIMTKIAEETAKAFASNKKTLNSKAMLVKVALSVFLCETLAVAACLGLLAIS